MSADFPVAKGSLNTQLMWDVYFGAGFVGVGVFVLLGDSRRTQAERVAALGLLLAMGLWYFVYGRLIEPGDKKAYPFQTVMYILFIPALYFSGSSSFVLFALCPMAYMTLPFVTANIVVVVFNLTCTVVFLARTGDVHATLTGPLPIGVLVIVFSVIFAATLERLTQLNRTVGELSHQAGIAAERQRLAGDIHDTVAQGLSSVVLLLEAALATDDPKDHIVLARDTARENLAEARALVGALTPAPLDGTSLVDALRRLAPQLRVIGEPRLLSTAADVVLLRTAQEALTNVRKHAQATETRVTLRFDQSVVLEVTDDGVGFDQNEANGYGLVGMRNRAEQIGGRLTVDSKDGTTVRLEVVAT